MIPDCMTNGGGGSWEFSLLQSVLRASPLGIVAMEAVRDDCGRVVDFRYVLVNPASESIFGHCASELEGERLTNCYPFFADAGMLERLIEVLETGVAYLGESEYRVDSLLRSFRLSVVKLNDGVLVTFSDITEQKKAQLELERSDERFRMLTDATEDIVWEYDVSSGVVWWGDNLRTCFGHEMAPDQLTVSGWASMVHPEDYDRVVGSFVAAIEGDEARWSSEYRFVRADGTYATVLDRAFIMRDSSGRAIRAVGAAIDLSQRRETAERLMLQASLLEAQADASPDAVVVMDCANRVIRTNERFRELTGREDSDLIGSDGHATLSLALGSSDSSHAHWDGFHHGEMEEYRNLIELSDGRAFELITKPLRGSERILGRVWFLRDVTAARESEEILRQHNIVLENSSVVLFRWRVEPNWPVELVSRNVEQFGYTAEELLTNKVTYPELIYPEDVARVAKEVETHLASETCSFEQVYRIVCKDGRVVWTLDRTVVDRDEHGKAISLHGIVMDIDDRKRAEEAAREAEAKLQNIASQIPGAVYQFRLRADGTTEIPYISDGVEELCLIKPEELYRDPTLIRAQISEDEVDAFDRSIVDSAETLTPWAQEFCVCRPDGVELILGGKSIPRREADGSVLWHGVMLDLTEQKRAEAELRRISAILERTNTIAKVGGWEIDVATGAMWWSNEVYRIHDLEVGRCPSIYEALKYYRDDSRAVIESALERGMWDGEAWDLVLPMVTASGREIWAHSQAEVVREDGRVVRLLGVIQDVTEFHKSKQELAMRAVEMERLCDAAEAASRAKSEFLANMSHEIRTPLTAILGFTEMLRDGGDHADSMDLRQRNAETILAAGRHLMTVINDVLDISKIEAGKLTVEMTETPLLEIIEETVLLIRVRGLEKGIALKVEFDSVVPDRIVLDPTRLRQILMNLLGNAVKFTESGSVTLRVSTQSVEHNEAQLLVLRVEDSGPGIPEEQREQLFTMFSQADQSLTRRHAGSGLGLVISRRLAVLMGGNVTLERSEIGVGSCFRVELPLNPVDGFLLRNGLGEGEALVGAASVPEMRTKLKGRVLLAEDGVDNQRLICFHLQRAGAEVDIAQNGAVALEMIEAAEASGKPYQLLVTDVQMPEMDGHTLARKLRERGSRLAIVALTAHAMPEDRQKCLDAGCDAYATKPIDRARLIATCARWMGRAGEKRVA